MAFDQVRLDPRKIIKDDVDELVIRTVIASEIVHQYSDGFAYKPAKELEKAAWTLNGRWIKLMDHPVHGLLQRKEDISGFTDNSKFVKNLKDPKTGRRNRRGILADTHFFKHNRGRPGVTPLPKDMYDSILGGNLMDVSIGFTFEKDITPGAWNGDAYDYAQRGFFFDHTVAPCETGRCPAPYCGIGIDQVKPIFIGLDPWETTEENIRSGHVDPAKFDPASLRTINIEGAEGVKAVVGCPKGKYEGGKCTVGMEVQSFLFAKSKFTLEQAKAWLKSHEGDVMPLEEIKIKIQELRDRRAAIQKKIDAYYTVKTRDPEIDRLYAEMNDLQVEITAWQEARVEKIIEKTKGDQKMDQETKEEFMAKCVESGKTEAECEELWNELQTGDEAISACVALCIARGKTIEECRAKCAGEGDQNQCVCPECGHIFSSEKECSEATCPSCAHVGCKIKLEEADVEYQECLTACLEAGKSMEECAEECAEKAPASDCPICHMLKRMDARPRAAFIRKYGKDILRVLSAPDSSASAGAGDTDIQELIKQADSVAKLYSRLTQKKRRL